jgi:hypothetical protein
MPSYTFEDKKTGKQFIETMSMDELDTFLEKNKHLRQVITSINIVSGVQGITHKVDGGWKDTLSKIAEAHPNSALAREHGRKTIKQSKTEQVIAKHRKRNRGRK